MSSPLLPNYLLSNRKRLDLSQEDVAFLLDTLSGAKISRHERFIREPGLKTALAYEVIYRRSVSELFSGLYVEVEQEIAVRARLLVTKSESLEPTQHSPKRHQALSTLADRIDYRSSNTL
jgi:hypothetical protein